jgi:hypothetical protein
MNESTTITLGVAYMVGAGVLSGVVTYFTAKQTIENRVTAVETRLETTVGALKESIDLLRDELRSYYQRKP